MLDRPIVTGSVGPALPRLGAKNVSANLAVELRAHGTAGSAPSFGPLVQSALGAVRNVATEVATKSSGNTNSVLQIEDADAAKFAVGDIVLVKEAGSHHVSPISAVSTGSGTATVTLLVAHPTKNFSASVKIEAVRTYYGANSGHPAVSVCKWSDDAIREKALGCRVADMSLDSFSVGKLAALSFGLEGLGFDRDVSAIPVTPTYEAGLPPVILNARVAVDGVCIDVNDVGLKISNTLGFITSVCDPNGRKTSRVSKREVSGSFNPYRASDSVAYFTKWMNGTTFSLFLYAANPTAVAGEIEDVIAFYLPTCYVVSLGAGDQDGILVDEVEFKALAGSDGTGVDIYCSFI
jgi:hypothetical protein